MFDWQLAIDKNTAALTQIVAGLFVLVGMRTQTPSSSDLIGVSTAKPKESVVRNALGLNGRSWVDARIKSEHDESVLVTRYTYFHLASVLRAAESALRRLIMLFMKVKGIKVGVYKPLKDQRLLPDFKAFEGKSDKPPKFALVDPRKPISSFLILSLSKDEEEDKEQTLRQAQGEANSGTVFDGTVDRTHFGEPNCPRISATALITRLRALDNALKTLPAQAKRMAREIEKRKAAPAGIKSVPPLRIGYPPGYRERHIHDVDHILEECHGLVMDWNAGLP